MFNRDNGQTPAGPVCSTCGVPVGTQKICSCGQATPNMSWGIDADLARYFIGVSLGDTPADVEATWGTDYTVCKTCTLRTWYFTYPTKPVGAGLGLAVCYGVVTAHGGRITVASDDGRGTTARVALPADEDAREGLAPPRVDVQTSTTAEG